MKAERKPDVRPIGDHLAELGLKEDTSAYKRERGVTTLYFNAGRALRERLRRRARDQR